MLNLATLESARFGLRTFRATLDTVDTSSLVERMIQESADLVILRVPPSKADCIRRLDHYGLTPIHADTLVGYSCELQAHTPPPPPGGSYTIDNAHDSDRQAIGELVDIVFARYPSHYVANPLLDRQDVVAGYREWALSHVGSNGRTAWVARVGGRIAAIACSSFDAARHECQGVLHGVHPDFLRSGIYTALIRHTQRHFMELGCIRLTIQTQAWNLPVQRVWVREGFVFTDVFETFHVNALLDTAHGRVERMELSFTDPANTEASTRILRAMLEMAGRARPEPRPPTLNSSIAIFEPIAAGQRYSLAVKTYDFARSCGKRIVAGTLLDSSMRPCAILRTTVESSA